MGKDARVRISSSVRDEIKEFVNKSEDYASMRHFVDKAVNNQLEKEKSDSMTTEERFERIEERLDELS
jgi:hypothetical protein